MNFRARLKILASEKHSSLFSAGFSDEEKGSFYVDTWAQCYKTFFVRKLWIFVIS
jgi:hypothetical protein